MSQIGTNKDIPITIYIKDSTGVAIDTDGFDVDIEVAIYQKKDNVIQLFKLSEGEVEVIDAGDGEILVRLDRVNTAKINTANPLFVEVVPISADANFEGGIRRWDAIVKQLPKINFSAI